MFQEPQTWTYILHDADEKARLIRIWYQRQGTRQLETFESRPIDMGGPRGEWLTYDVVSNASEMEQFRGVLTDG